LSAAAYLRSRPVAAAYVGQMAAANPDSPLHTLSQGDTVAIRADRSAQLTDGAGGSGNDVTASLMIERLSGAAL